jgi:hypothetical protein
MGRVAYTCRDEGGGETVIRASSKDALIKKAAKWVRDGSWDDDATIWVRVRVTDPKGDSFSQTVAVDPKAPDCVRGRKHAWDAPHRLVGGDVKNPGVFANAGGVVVREACTLCGCRRVTDTWATDPATGQQGLRSVSYTEAYYTVEEL